MHNVRFVDFLSISAAVDTDCSNTAHPATSPPINTSI